MKQIDIRKKRILYLLFFLLLAVSIVFTVVQLTSSTDKVKVITCCVSGGWGYQITVNGKVYIDQPFIPVLPGRRAFPDEKSALRTGTLVKRKLIHHQPPTLTREDLKKLGLDSLMKAN